MFCPKCGSSDQKIETYCRRCGNFLPDFDNIRRKETTPEEHLKINGIFNAMTAVVSLTLAILLYAFFLGKDDTPIIIYITAGFLTAMFFWQAQTFWRTMILKKQLRKAHPRLESENVTEAADQQLKEAKTKNLLNEINLNDVVPASVTEHTTARISEKVPRSSS